MKRAFVTGGSGFVGRNLIKALVVQGYQVNAIARSPKSEKAVQDVGAQAIKGDLDNDVALRQGMEGCDVVFHAAAKVEQWGDPVDFYRKGARKPHPFAVGMNRATLEKQRRSHRCYVLAIVT